MPRNAEKTITLSLRKLRAAEAAAKARGIKLSEYLDLPESQPREAVSVKLLPSALKEARIRAKSKGIFIGTLLQRIIEKELLL